MSELKLILLGSPRLELDGRALVLERNKALALLAYLAVEGGAPSRETLAALLWPDYGQEKAFAYLRRTLWSLNQGLGEGWLQAGRDVISLRRADGLWLDVEQFHLALAECIEHGHSPSQACPACIAPLARAAEIYQGGFMAGFSLRDSPAFDEWQFFQAESLKAELASALQRLGEAYAEQGELEQALASARRWLSLDTLNEAAHQRLMVLYAQAGQRSAALRQFIECQRLLQAELGAAPQPETVALYERIKSGELMTAARPAPVVPASLSPAEGAPPSSIEDHSPLVYNLPVPPTPFIGRLDELAEVERLLGNPDVRLLTVVGPGGIGKTRLAIQSAAQIIERDGRSYSHGAAFVPLASLSSPEFLVSAIAGALQMPFRFEDVRGRTTESQKTQLIEFLRSQRLLLVLDNFEHLVSGAELLSEVLASCPGIKILATSRERLNLAEEWALELSGMAYPSEDSLPGLETYSAVRLFLQHASRVQAGFDLSPADRAAVARICRLVQGTPLAIELAAAWVRMLPPSEIAAEIERNLDFLSGTLRGAPERHHSLRAVFEHSWALLTPDEQLALSRLSILRGPFGRQAAQALIFGKGQPADMDVLGLLTALVDKSLLRRLPQNVAGSSYMIHELLKQYAAEKLAASPDALQQALDSHRAYFMGFLGSIWQDLRGPRQFEALAQIDAQIDDIRLAWRTALAAGRLSALHEAMPALFGFYSMRNRFQDAEEDFRLSVAELERLRSQPGLSTVSPELADGVYALALAFFSSFLFNVGRFELARAYHRDSFALVDNLSPGDRASLLLLLGFGWNLLDAEEVTRNYQTSLEIFERGQDRWSAARAKLNYGSFQQYGVVDPEEARRLYQSAYDELHQLGDRLGTVLALNSLADLAYAQGKYEQVFKYGLESRSITQQLGDRWHVIASIFDLGQAAVALGEYEQAHQYYDVGIQLLEPLGNRQLLSRMLACRGYVHYLQADYRQARAQFEQALELSRQLRDWRETAMQLMNLGNIARASGDLAESKRCYLESIQILQGSGANWELSISLKRLASLYFAQGDVSLAWENYRRALRISLETRRPAETLENLVGIAELLVLQGFREEAVELLALCLAQKETPQDVRAQAVRLLDGLAGELPAERYTLAAKRGQTIPLNTAAEKMLAE